jgi:hypothetical protein
VEDRGSGYFRQEEKKESPTTPHFNIFTHENLMSLFLHTHPPTPLFQSVKFSNIHDQYTSRCLSLKISGICSAAFECQNSKCHTKVSLNLSRRHWSVRDTRCQ